MFNVRVVVSAIFDFMTEEDCMGRIEIVILLSSGVQHGAFASKNVRAPEEDSCSAGLKNDIVTFYLPIKIKTRRDML